MAPVDAPMIAAGVAQLIVRRDYHQYLHYFPFLSVVSGLVDTAISRVLSLVFHKSFATVCCLECNEFRSLFTVSDNTCISEFGARHFSVLPPLARRSATQSGGPPVSQRE